MRMEIHIWRRIYLMTSNYEWSDDTTSQYCDHNTTVLRSVRIPILKVTTYKWVFLMNDLSGNYIYTRIKTIQLTTLPINVVMTQMMIFLERTIRWYSRIHSIRLRNDYRWAMAIAFRNVKDKTTVTREKH